MERPWEPMGMTTEKWREIKPSRVLVDSLRPSQAHLLFAAIMGEPSSHCGDAIPHAVLWAGELRISDGHHRIARAKLRGEQTIDVRVAVPFVHFRPCF